MSTFGNLFNKRSTLYAAATSSVPSVPDSSSISLPHGVLSTTLPLEAVIFPDLDVSLYPVTVAEAMQTPAVARAIAIYSTISSRFKLDSDDNSTPWLNVSNGYMTPELRIAQTVQSLIWHNCAMWKVERDAEGTILSAEHIDRGRWTTDSGTVKIDNVVVNDSQFIYFQGLLPTGFLDAGRNSVRQYTSISQTINNRAAMPSPVTLVKETQDSGANDDEVAEAMDQLKDSLTSKRGGMVFVPYGIDIEGYGAGDNANEMQTAARNAVRLDLANFLNINASLLEGSADGTSDSYTNTLMTQNELLELSIKGFTEPIANRLSADDVSAPGVTIRFNYDSFDTAPNDSSDKGIILLMR